jgi:hypothetical protein
MSDYYTAEFQQAVHKAFVCDDDEGKLVVKAHNSKDIWNLILSELNASLGLIRFRPAAQRDLARYVAKRLRKMRAESVTEGSLPDWKDKFDDTGAGPGRGKKGVFLRSIVQKGKS